MISVLCPSRHRPSLLIKSLNSLRDHSGLQNHRVEYLVIADSDDLDTFITADQWGARAFVTAERFGYSRLHQYYNFLAGQAEGDWMLLWNDDALMETPGWNVTIEDVSPDYVVADLQTVHSPWLCTFPAVRRWAIEAVGGFSPHTCHCDTFWQDLGNLTGTITPVDVHVNHDRYDLTGNNNDETFRESQQGYRSRDYYSEPVQDAIKRDGIRILSELRKIIQEA